jgi:hypothetical protein
MPSAQMMKYCSNCGRNTLHIQQQQGTATNLVHIILVIMTLGLWLVVWALAQPIRAMTEPPKCTVCGNSSLGFSIPREPIAPQGQKDTVNEDRIPCPFCAEMIKREARVCRFCQRDLPEQWAGVIEPVQQDGVLLEGIRRKVTKSVTDGTPSEVVTYVFGGSEYPTLQEAKDAKENTKWY